MLVDGLKFATELIIFVLFDVIAFRNLLAIVQKVFNSLSFILNIVFDKLIGIGGSADSFFLQELLLSRVLYVTCD